MEKLIATSDICTYHDVEYTFISSLQDAGLVKLTVIDHSSYIPETELRKLEQMITLHNELEINVAGIEAITHLLDRVTKMQEEMRRLQNKARL